MKRYEPVFKKSISALLCAAMAVSLGCAFLGTAEAATSLPAIENIKTSDETFNILEIVPEADQGSIGYYIDGEEPWVTLAGEVATPAARKTYIEGTLHSLLNKENVDSNVSDNNYSIKLVSTASGVDDSYPLNYIGGYSEVYPWVWATEPDTTYAGYKQMPLAAEEKGTATGDMDYVGMGYGDYIIGDYEYVGAGGDCVQLIEGFKTSQATGEDGYWYNVAFDELTYKEIEDLSGDVTIDPDSEAADWTVIYQEVTSADDYDLNIGGKYYEYIGVVGERDFPGLDVSKTYYGVVLGQSGQPYTSYSAACAAAGTGEYSLFADTTGGFREKEDGETGYFSKISYEYVGDGNGAYAFTPSSSGTSYNVTTKIVYYTGGYSNNNWFLRHVFDYDDDEIEDDSVDISVNTVAAADLTESQIDAADMIVLNLGLDIKATTFSGIYRNTFGSSDLPSSLVGEIALTDKPVIFDYNLTSLGTTEGLNAKSTAQALLSKALTNRSGSGFSTDDCHTFVGGNIYCIDSLGWSVGSGDDTIYHAALPLASEKFDLASAIEYEHLKEGDAFYPVFEEIYYENFLREIRDESEDERLSTKISMAAVIRYIVNYANTREVDEKETVRVLDIEPRTGSLSSDQTSALADWLDIPEANLIVTTMSTSEFIGLEDDISEDYDLLYIGDSADGFNTDSTSFNVGGFIGIGGDTYSFDYITYNDYTMTYRESSSDSSINNDSIAEYLTNRKNASWLFNINISDIVFGLRYTSIGDKVESGDDYRLSGLLDRDYRENYSISDKVWLTLKAKYSYDTYYYGTVLDADSESQTYRYSGNDLTEAASQKIEDFASSGYPVILADSLLEPPVVDDSTITDAEAHIHPLLITYNYSAEPEITIADSILKVSIKSAGDLFYTINSVTCQLYKNGSPAQDGDGNYAITTLSPYRSATFNLSDYDYETGDEFYCTLKIDSVRYPLLPIITLNASSDHVGKTATITIQGQAEDMFVDNSSVMYETINDIAGRTNVMNWSSLTSEVTDIKQTLLKRFVNLSKPTIEFWNDTYPLSYEMDSNGVMNSLSDDDNDGIYELEYAFKIENEADPYPEQTRYLCTLYLDLNGNGLFEDDEAVTDVGLREWTVYSDSYGSSGQRVENGDLQGSYGTSSENQHYYYLTYEMPSDMVGIIPWKLEVTDISFFGGHDSVIDYTRVAPAEEPETIDVLQINATGNGNTNNLQYDIANTNGTYNKLFQEVSSDFKVTMTTIPANFDSLWSTSSTTYGTSTTGSTGSTTVNTLFTKSGGTYTKKTGTGELETFDSLTKLLESYDMLIIGFDDAYQNLDLDVTEAIANYINDDHPVLMTHDSLSYYSLADGSFATDESDATLHAENIGSFFHPNYRTWWTADPDYVYGSSTTSYGYYSNTLLRDLIGVDRYGVTSLETLSNGQSIGMTKYAGIGRTTDISSTASASQLAESALRTYIKTLDGFSSWTGGYVPSWTYYSGGATIDATRENLLDEISDAGYSIAWKADKSRTQTVSETQGLTNEVLYRFMDTGISAWLSGKNVDSYTIKYTNSDSSRLGLSTKVTQVNKGQITTYPFDINTDAFSEDQYDPSASDVMQVQLTHAQSYQLNMNSDDMIVWYCLASDSTYGSGIYQKNDVVNAYYVYTCGNVTYTGSGHTAIPASYSASNTAANNEAKLFINTMIAAYRVGLSNSSVSFTNDDGSVKGITEFFVVTDGDTVLSVDDDKYADSARNIYFTVTDSNVDESKIMKAAFSYNDTALSLTIYDADTDQPVTDGKLRSTYTYYVKLDKVISEIERTTGKTQLTVDDLNENLKVAVTTTFGTGATSTKTATLELKQYRLFDLS